MRLFKLFLFVVLIFPLTTLAKQKQKSSELENSSLVKDINTAVEVLEKRISSNDITMPLLKVEYNFFNATEGVPPDLRFYFETKTVGMNQKSILRVFKTHVGREVYSVDRTYYFDETGKPMKFLEVNSGISGKDGFPATRNGIIYSNSGKIIWSSSHASAEVSFKDVKSIFETLDKGLGKFQ